MKFPKKISDVVPISLTVLYYFITVTAANLSGGLMEAMKAGALQIAWTLPISIFVFKSCSYFAQRNKDKFSAYGLAISIPTLVSVLGTIAWHMVFNSPEPLLSAIPTLVSTPIATFLWAFEKRREMYVK